MVAAGWMVGVWLLFANPGLWQPVHELTYSMNFDPLPGLTVTVDSIAYDPTRPAPPDRPHPLFRDILRAAVERCDGRRPRLLAVDAVPPVSSTR